VCKVVWHSHHRDAQNNYDLEKINVEWSGLLPLSCPQKYYDLEKINVEWSAQKNYYDLKKINVEWSRTHLKIMCTRSWCKRNALEKKNVEWKCLRTKM
jgi:hypothetical protein